MAITGATRRFALLLLLAAGLVSVFYVSSYHKPSFSTASDTQVIESAPTTKVAEERTPNAIAPKLGNETAKAELGRAAWKVLHTTFARFPDEPTPEERLTLKTYIHLFQRLYPCGECAEHFHELLQKFPPQTSSRSAAAAWGCHVHNEVNKKLKKDIFDCGNIGDFYDCGCADDDVKDGKKAT